MVTSDPEAGASKNPVLEDGVLKAGHEQYGCNKKGLIEKCRMDNQWGHPEQKHKPSFNF